MLNHVEKDLLERHQKALKVLKLLQATNSHGGISPSILERLRLLIGDTVDYFYEPEPPATNLEDQDIKDIFQ